MHSSRKTSTLKAGSGRARERAGGKGVREKVLRGKRGVLFEGAGGVVAAAQLFQFQAALSLRLEAKELPTCGGEVCDDG